MTVFEVNSQSFSRNFQLSLYVNKLLQKLEYIFTTLVALLFYLKTLSNILKES